MNISEKAWERKLLGSLRSGRKPPLERKDEADRVQVVRPGIGDHVVRDHRQDLSIVRPDREVVIHKPVRPIDPGHEPSFVIHRPTDQKWVRPVRVDPKWDFRKQVPTQPVTPVQTIHPPLTVGSYQLWAMPDNLGILGVRAGGLAFFARSQPRLETFGLTLRKEQIAGTLKITGGDASLALSAYPEHALEEVETLRTSWDQALTAAGHGNRAWSYQPLVMQGLSVTIDLPESYLSGPPVISVAADMGDASVRVPLTEFGAQSFKTALETKRTDTLPGSCTMGSQFLAQHGKSLTTRQQNLVAQLSAMLVGAGPELIRVVNPQVTIEANVIVRGHGLLETAVVNWTPSEGHTPEGLSFGPTGGEFKAILASDDLTRITIDWNAVVLFKPTGWPTVEAKGKLSVARNDWNLVINPESWIAGYTVVILPFDAKGNVMQQTDPLPASDTLSCEMRYTAPFLPGGKALTSAFATRNEAMQVAFPTPPGQAPGEVRLTMFALRGGKDQMLARVLKPEESLVVVRVFADARIDIKTNQDAVEESSEVGHVMTALAGMAARKAAIGESPA